MNKQLLLTAAAMLTIGLIGGYWLADKPQSETITKTATKQPLYYRNPMNPSATSPVPAKDAMGMDYVAVYTNDDIDGSTDKTVERKILFYRNPMNPSVTSPVPAKDNMGMDYVPVYADANAASGDPLGTVKIDAVTEQNMGVRTAIAKQTLLSHVVRAVGRIAYDEERIVRLHPKTEGWIETLRVDKTGQWVKQNEDLLSIYSPQLVASQQEYVLALNNLKVLEKSPIEDIRRGAEDLVKSSRERLKLLDVPTHQLHDLTETHHIKKSLHIHTPASGIVINIGAREGQYVTPETELYMIADLSKVWAYADIYEYELPWVKEGDPVEMRLAGVPGRTFKGKLAFIYPYAEAKTRTIKVRLTFDNTGLLLKPDMFAEITIHAGKQLDAVVIPAEAVIRSGAQTQVFVVRGAGKFEPRLVTTGLASGSDIAIVEGLNAGEEVVTSAQFLIDSESRLHEATAKMREPEAVSTPNSEPSVNDHGDHQHD
ncbi:efflux transporter periplasmic adaptor subunit [Methylomonas lenta]|uniref:Efflux transporter periplasmic adaptor subunit n=1 Tax=Methylomonas lenta TaxID=980561 RepID=A0A177MYP4_9GAMM|nr:MULTISPECIES: efflux RND transporter periplasmic adaptor subunit [Methylomonas]MCK9607985.1 efflux RND transporter periplasmic adaptor subunit [Methylomonas sp.]OAI10705.1 efflux transporter periplasmic adaptor subunit [Methylomonas lenta]